MKNNTYLPRLHNHNFVYRLLSIMGLATIAFLSSGGPCALAYCDQYHPFTPEMIDTFKVNASPVAGPGYYIGGAAGIDQGPHNDCWIESALAAVARTRAGARLISEMIALGPNGGYQVTFLDDPTQTFSVSQADITKFHLRDSATWAEVIEAAGIKRYPELLQHGETGNERLTKRSGEPLNALSLQMMTGHQAFVVTLSQEQPEIVAEILARNTRMNMPMTAGSPPNNPNPSLVKGHYYTVLNYEPASRIITLRNPWGDNIPNSKDPGLPGPGHTKDGVLNVGAGVVQMQLSVFIKYFGTLAWSRVFHL